MAWKITNANTLSLETSASQTYCIFYTENLNDYTLLEHVAGTRSAVTLTFMPPTTKSHHSPMGLPLTSRAAQRACRQRQCCYSGLSPSCCRQEKTCKTQAPVTTPSVKYHHTMAQHRRHSQIRKHSCILPRLQHTLGVP